MTAREQILAADPLLETQKAETRRAMRALRSELVDPGAALALIENFPLELAKQGPVAGYWPMSSEIDCRPLLAALAKAGRKVALPRMEAREGLPRFLIWNTGEALTADAFGVPSPPSKSTEVSPKLILTPLLAFDRAGRRLGQGGGHYDRIIALNRAQGAIAVGLAYAGQEIDSVPTGPHDTPLDWVVTEKEAIRCVAPIGDQLRGLSGD